MFEPRKVGWLDLGTRGLREGGGNCLKYLKRGWNRKEERGNKDFKKGGGKLGQRVGALKRGRLEPPSKLCTRNIANNCCKFICLSKKGTLYFAFIDIVFTFPFPVGASNVVFLFPIFMDTLLVSADFRSDFEGSLVKEFRGSNC